MVSYLSVNSKMQLWWQAEPYLDFFSNLHYIQSAGVRALRPVHTADDV